MAVYMIRAGCSGPVKIGVAVDVEGRVAELQTAHHEELRLVRIIDGSFAEEVALHRHYASARIRGEWFEWSDDMLDIVPEITTPPTTKQPMAGTPDESAASLVQAIERYLAISGETATNLGRRVANDPSLVGNLRRGRSPTIRMAIRIMDAIQPKDAA